MVPWGVLGGPLNAPNFLRPSLKFHSLNFIAPTYLNGMHKSTLFVTVLCASWNVLNYCVFKHQPMVCPIKVSFKVFIIGCKKIS